jgi:ferredoxin-type protein NapG
VEACPVDAIRPVLGGPAEGTPHIDAQVTACTLCSGLACTRACPSGALVPLAPCDVRMGTARIDPDRCTAYRGLPCRICVEVCPVPGVLKLSRGKGAAVPAAASQACTGCGLCEEHCPADGAIRVVPLLPGSDGRVRLLGLGPDAAERLQ